MSIETLLQENTAAVLTLAEAIKAQTAITERVVLGQQAAIEKLEGAKAAATGTRTRRKAGDDAPSTPAAEDAGNAAPADTASGAAVASNASEPKTNAVLDADGMKALCGAFTKAAADDADRAARVAWLKSLAGYFFPNGDVVGTAALVATPDNAKKAEFFIERKKAGLDVDFGAEYDFDGDPKQEVASTGGGDDFD